MPILRLSFLGEPRLGICGDQVLATPGPKGLGLLACLATAPELRMGRTELVKLLWADASSTPAARHALRQCLVRLKSQLGDAAGVLVTDDDAVWLNPDLVSLDLAEIRLALQTGARKDIPELSLMVRGRFCAGLDVGLAEFEAWLRDRQRECDQLCADLHGMAAAILAECGEETAAIAAARRRLECEPFQDDAHAALVALCIGFGRRHEAAAAHKDCHDLFAKELGIAPAPQVDQALRMPVSARHIPLSVPAEVSPIAHGPVLGAFSAGLVAAAVLFQVLAPSASNQTPESDQKQMSIWVSPASAASIQEAGFTESPANSPEGSTDASSQTAIRQMLEGDTDYAMLYPAGC
ncbi:MAG: BTAD domain-containing putative transcriptional regulator [Paracoccus sp. (in: a-proteobacteria)]